MSESVSESVSYSAGSPQTSCQGDPQPIVPDLFIPKVPPPIIKRAARKKDPKPSLAGDPAVIALCETWKLEMEQERHKNGLIAESIGEAIQNQDEMIDIIQFIHEELRSVHGSWNIEVPTGDVQLRQSFVGKTLMLGGGIEMTYITPPGVYFAQLTSAELDWFGEHELPRSPVLRAPTVSYRSLKEGWRHVVLSEGLQFTTKQGKLLAPNESSLVCLKVLLATAEIGDIGAFCTMWNEAKTVAMIEREELLAVSIAEKMIPFLERVHPHPKAIASNYYCDIGLLHETLAARLIKKGESEAANRELVAAALAYKSSADKTREFYPSTMVRFKRYYSLGLCLIYLNELEMAKRALMWAFTDRMAFKRGDFYETQAQTMAAVWRLGFLSEEDCDREIKNNLKSTRSINKTTFGNEPVHLVKCRKCQVKCEETHLVYSRCSRCTTPYCSRECQSSDWQDHKKDCKQLAEELQKAKPETHESGYYIKYTQCPESTRKFVAASNMDSMHFPMSLASWAGLMEKMKMQRTTGESKP